MIMTNYDVVKKLIGNINPAGDASRDKERFENLKEAVKLVELLLSDIAYDPDEIRTPVPTSHYCNFKHFRYLPSYVAICSA